MTIQSLVYPLVGVAAFSVFFGAMELPMASLAFAALSFLCSLFILALSRREQKETNKPKQNLLPEKEGKELRDKIITLEAELSSLRTQNDSYRAALDAKQKKESIEAGLQESDQAVVQFVRSLQDKGRFLDFVMADIHSLPDAQVGAVARVVHSGLKSLMQDYFSLSAISAAEEGQTIEIDQAEFAKAYRLLGAHNEQSPIKGTLVHKGWKADKRKLPKSQRLESAEELMILTPAEIEVKG